MLATVEWNSSLCKQCCENITHLELKLLRSVHSSTNTGKGLNQFRENMKNDLRIKHIVDYEEVSEVFSSQGFDGGVNYFLWDIDYNGKANYIYHSSDGTVSQNKRYINSDLGIIIRDLRQHSIIKKVNNENDECFSKIVSSRAPFGFGSDLFRNPVKYRVELQDDKVNGFCLVHGLSNVGDGYKRDIKYIDSILVKKNKSSIDKYKLYFSKAFNIRMTAPPKIIKGYPNEISTETFLKMGDFDTEEEMLNCLSYIETKFFRALFFYNRHSLNISKSSFELIPLQDFSKPWTDDKLYAKYNLTEEEIHYIEENIAPMGDQANSADPEVNEEEVDEEYSDDLEGLLMMK